MASFELDLERMIPSLLRHRLSPTYSNFLTRTCAMCSTNRTETKLSISITKGHSTQLDYIGKTSPQYFHVLSNDNLVAAVSA